MLYAVYQGVTIDDLDTVRLHHQRIARRLFTIQTVNREVHSVMKSTHVHHQHEGMGRKKNAPQPLQAMQTAERRVAMFRSSVRHFHTSHHLGSGHSRRTSLIRLSDERVNFKSLRDSASSTSLESCNPRLGPSSPSIRILEPFLHSLADHPLVDSKSARPDP